MFVISVTPDYWGKVLIAVVVTSKYRKSMFEWDLIDKVVFKKGVK